MRGRKLILLMVMAFISCGVLASVGMRASLPNPNIEMSGDSEPGTWSYVPTGYAGYAQGYSYTEADINGGSWVGVFTDIEGEQYQYFRVPWSDLPQGDWPIFSAALTNGTTIKMSWGSDGRYLGVEDVP